MIQRKQTLWFLLSGLIAGLSFILPFGFKNTTSLNSYSINIRNFYAESDTILVLIIGFIIVLNLVAVFLFKKRNIQVLFAVLAILFGLAAFCYEIYFSTIDGNKITFGIANSVLYIGLALPLIASILAYMAMRGVSQDVKLLKETARLR